MSSDATLVVAEQHSNIELEYRSFPDKPHRDR
jgi:hypothetical protein